MKVKRPLIKILIIVKNIILQAVPPNSVAEVPIPLINPDAVSESYEPVAKVKGVKFLRKESGRSIYEFSSGWYCFKCKIRS